MANKKTLKAPARRIITAMIERVLTQPKLLDQNSFPDSDNAVCDTAYCAAGHIVYLKSPRLFAKLVKQNYLAHKGSLTSVFANRNKAVDWSGEAVKILGLSDHGTPEDNVAFHGYIKLFGMAWLSWPQEYRDEYSSAKSDKGRARVFANLWTKVLAVDGDVYKL